MLETLFDTTTYIETLLVVKSKERKTLPFRLTPIQRKVVREQRLRNIYLKPRQVGLSTLILAQNFARVVTEENFTAVTAAHDADTTEILFDTIHYFYNNLPPEFRPVAKYSNRRELYFPVLNSRYIVFTAGGKNGPGRGTTANAIHGSEVSRWPNPDQIFGGLMESATKSAMVDLESTANGAGGFFHNLYTEATAGVNGYRAHFFPWWEQTEYRLSDKEAASYMVDTGRELSEDETRLMERAGLDREQINWRRWKRSTLKALFFQEYPEDSETCFITSGNSFFETDIVLRAKTVGGRPPIETKDNGNLLVWEQPQPGQDYVIGADVAEGLSDGDYCSAYVLKQSTGEDVAAIHGRWSPHVYAGKLETLAATYNQALVGVERNNHGHAVLTTLINNGTGNCRIYKHRDYDQHGQEQLKPGWPTTSKTKPIMLSGLAKALEDAPENFRDNAMLGECLTFTYHDDGSVGAQSGCYDDRVMARAIALEIWKHPARPGFRRL
jgi:hypothetical protein